MSGALISFSCFNSNGEGCMTMFHTHRQRGPVLALLHLLQG